VLWDYPQSCYTRPRKIQKEYPIDMEDAVVAVKDDKGKIKLHRAST
jgi:uncharacterized membrane protein